MGNPQTQYDDLQEAHDRLRSESAAEIRKLRREAREAKEATKAAEEKLANAAAETDEHAAALRDQIERGEERLCEAEILHREELDKLKKELAAASDSACFPAFVFVRIISAVVHNLRNRVL